VNAERNLSENARPFTSTLWLQFRWGLLCNTAHNGVFARSFSLKLHKEEPSMKEQELK
jgi:hypothetical protein